MRIIFDYDDEDDKDLIEIQLTEQEIKSLLEYQPLEKDTYNEIGSKSTLNIFIRRMSHAVKKRDQQADD